MWAGKRLLINLHFSLECLPRLQPGEKQAVSGYCSLTKLDLSQKTNFLIDLPERCLGAGWTTVEILAHST